MPCRRQSRESTQSRAESKRAVKPRASRLAGSARGRASRIGEAVQTRQDGKRTRPSTKARQKAAKRHRFSCKQRRGQAPALHVWSGQFAKKRAYSIPANSTPCVRATNCPRPLAEQRSAFGGRGVVPRDRVSIFKAQKYAGGREGNTPIKRVPPARNSKCAKQIRCTPIPNTRGGKRHSTCIHDDKAPNYTAKVFILIIV